MQFLVVLATFQVLSSRVATFLDSTDTEHFHHCRKFCWMDGAGW